MYLKRVNGPRAITLPDGSVISLADLPPPDTARWVASRKATVVRAVAAGLISQQDALERYALTDEEFEAWCRAVADHGIEALKVTSIQKFRQL